MANPSKAKGSRHEVRVRDYLATQGIVTVRPALSGSRDVGDLVGIPHWTVECKNTASGDLAGAMDEARREADNGSTEYYCVVKHRNRAPVEYDYVILDLKTWARLLRGKTLSRS